MKNNTKIAIGLAAAVVVGYIVYKSSKPKTQTQSGSDVTPQTQGKCPAGQVEIQNYCKQAPCPPECITI